MIAPVMGIDASLAVSPWLLALALPALALVLAPIVARRGRSEARMPAERLIARIARRAARRPQ